MNGTIFDIKEFSIHDGPGARVTVFFKGCPLRCAWCHNPEGLSPHPQLMHKRTMCVECGACRAPCDHAECAPYGRCLHACPNGCLSVSGECIEVEALAARLRGYRELLARQNGGITFSGGEPLWQAGFVLALADRLEGMHLALQTSGYAAPATYRAVVERMDYIMQDVKLVDHDAHRRHTGVDNALILENITWLKQSGKPYVLRVPLIPGITDTEDNLCAIASLAGDAPVELLRYNPLAGAKYEMLGGVYSPDLAAPNPADPISYFKNARMG